MLGYEPITLSEDEFTTQWQSIATNEERDSFLKEHSSILTDAGELTLSEHSFYEEAIGETAYNSYTDVLYVFPDSICENLLSVIRNRYIMTTESISYENARTLEQAFSAEYPEITDTGVSYAIRLSTLQVNTTKASNFVLQASMLYAAVVLMVICLTVLSLQQLLDASQYKYRFSVLRKLGVEDTHIGKLVLKQLGMLKEGFYHRPLTVIRPIDIENFLKGMRRDGRSDSYISKARGMLYQIFQKAEANDLVRRNPVRLAEKMRATGTAKRKEAFTTAEVAHLMKVLPDDRMGLSIRLLLGTGMRMQELLALEPQFIEEDGSVIHIRQAVKVVKGTVSIGSPKSKDSIRDIPVPLNIRPCAIKLRDTTDQFIWESPKTGLPCNPTHFRDVFRKSLEEAGDVRLLTPHSCRHTYVSQMQALGVDIQTIQSIVGHADTEMTEHYLHVQESIRQSAIQLFSEAFSA